ncbi:MAG: ABC transporter substrate-binding protein [Bacteroidales bacterium]|nr:ABC transporter substrate-binding protein [Bacteroidales bacterium]
MLFYSAKVKTIYKINTFLKKQFSFYLFFALLGFFTACTNQPEQKQFVISPQENLIQFAKGVRVMPLGDGFLLQIDLPWKSSAEAEKQFLLWPDSLDVPLKFQTLPLIKTPVKKLVTLSSTQWSPLLKLGLENHIVGISEADYVLDSLMQQLLAANKVVEVAKNGQFDFEKLINTKAELVLFSPYPTGTPVSLTRTGITLLAWPDYIENSPLGRAEWFRILGFLTQKNTTTDKWFADVVQNYQSLKQLVADSEHQKPTIIAEKAFNGQWYIPGGKSYLAQIFEDAGADYLWRDESSTASVPLDIETIIAKGSAADYWRISQASSADYGYSQLLKENALYSSFEAFNNRKVILCNTFKTGYFEKSQYEPDVLLADFIHIFHPNLLPNHQPVYHHLLTE